MSQATRQHPVRIALVAVILNAILQALLILPNATPALTWWSWPLGALSGLGLIAATAVIIAAFLLSIEGRCTSRAAVSLAFARPGALLIYSVVLIVLAILGFSLWVLPGIVVVALTPYLPIAIVDGRRDALRSSLRAIGARTGRWILLAIVTAVIAVALWVASALISLFIPGVLGAGAIWLVLGLVGILLVRMWCKGWRRAVSAGSSASVPA